MPDHGRHVDLGGYVLGVLDPQDAAAFMAHLVGCELCRREVAGLEGMRELLENAASPIDVPPHLEERTFAAVERAAQGGAGFERQTPFRRWQQLRPPRRTIELRRVLAVAAAILLLGAGAAVIREATRPHTAVAQVIDLEAPAGRSGRAVARVQTTGDVGVIEMDVENLPPPPPGFFFECWLVSPQGDSIERPNRVSVGTFGVDQDGRARVRWDFRADTRRFSHMGVTLEPEDGDPVHTTDRVLGATRLL